MAAGPELLVADPAGEPLAVVAGARLLGERADADVARAGPAVAVRAHLRPAASADRSTAGPALDREPDAGGLGQPVAERRAPPDTAPRRSPASGARADGERRRPHPRGAEERRRRGVFRRGATRWSAGRRRAGEQRVLTVGQRIDPEHVGRRGVRLCPAEGLVGAAVADLERIVAVIAEQRVVTGAPFEHVVALAAVDRVRAGVATQDVIERCAGHALDGYEVGAAAAGVLKARARQVHGDAARDVRVKAEVGDVHAGVSGEEIAAGPGHKHVVPAPAEQLVGPRAAEQNVASLAAGELVRAVTGGDQDILRERAAGARPALRAEAVATAAPVQLETLHAAHQCDVGVRRGLAVSGIGVDPVAARAEARPGVVGDHAQQREPLIVEVDADLDLVVARLGGGAGGEAIRRRQVDPVRTATRAHRHEVRVAHGRRSARAREHPTCAAGAHLDISTRHRHGQLHGIAVGGKLHLEQVKWRARVPARRGRTGRRRDERQSPGRADGGDRRPERRVAEPGRPADLGGGHGTATIAAAGPAAGSQRRGRAVGIGPG
ncbi:MAG TPA: hypothetical protein VFM58_21680 [Solirubrobacteraceae bacterium]|nr:hypothetical protein [Solirubrobacteraceae bacterium]